jgi:hypothetical protein
MVGPLSTEDIVTASLKGVVVAQKTYEEWSGEWLWKAPEYLTTVFVAQKLAKLSAPKYITLENSVGKAIEGAGAKGRGKFHSKMRENGRFDILLWWKNGTPRAPIEVKCQVLKFDKIRTDVERISEVINRNKSKSTIAFGVVAFYSSCGKDHTFSAKEKLEKSLENILQDAKELVGSSCHVSLEKTRTYLSDNSAWAGAAIVLKPKNA